MAYKKLLGIIPTIHSAQLAKGNLDLATKKKKTSKDFLETGMKNIVGIEMIKLESSFIEDF